MNNFFSAVCCSSTELMENIKDMDYLQDVKTTYLSKMNTGLNDHQTRLSKKGETEKEHLNCLQDDKSDYLNRIDAGLNCRFDHISKQDEKNDIDCYHLNPLHSIKNHSQFLFTEEKDEENEQYFQDAKTLNKFLNYHNSYLSKEEEKDTGDLHCSLNERTILNLDQSNHNDSLVEIRETLDCFHDAETQHFSNLSKDTERIIKAMDYFQLKKLQLLSKMDTDIGSHNDSPPERSKVTGNNSKNNFSHVFKGRDINNVENSIDYQSARFSEEDFIILDQMMTSYHEPSKSTSCLAISDESSRPLLKL